MYFKGILVQIGEKRWIFRFARLEFLKWRCKSCDAEFGTRSNLYSHVKGVHKGIKRIKW